MRDTDKSKTARDTRQTLNSASSKHFKDTMGAQTAMRTQYPHQARTSDYPNQARTHQQTALPDDETKRLAVVGISAEDWLQGETADSILVTRLFAVLRTTLEEMQQLATMLDLYMHMSHDFHRAVSPHPVGGDLGVG